MRVDVFLKAEATSGVPSAAAAQAAPPTKAN
jgi:hypothetical protein